MTSPAPKTVSDGFGGTWYCCDRAGCGLQVVRPGKVQCDCDKPEAVWSRLVDRCGASPDGVEDFVTWWLNESPGVEYRFQGALGFGGKLWNERRGLRVSYYREDRTDERDEMIAQVMQDFKQNGWTELR